MNPQFCGWIQWRDQCSLNENAVLCNLSNVRPVEPSSERYYFWCCMCVCVCVSNVTGKWLQLSSEWIDNSSGLMPLNLGLNLTKIIFLPCLSVYLSVPLFCHPAVCPLPTLAVGEPLYRPSKMAVAVPAGKSILVPTWTDPQAGQASPFLYKYRIVSREGRYIIQMLLWGINCCCGCCSFVKYMIAADREQM